MAHSAFREDSPAAGRCLLRLIAALGLALSLAGCGALNLGAQAEQARAAWKELLGHYQQRLAVAGELAKAAAKVPEAAQPVARLQAASAQLAKMPAREDMVNDQAAFSAHQALQDELARGLGLVMQAAAGEPAVEALRPRLAKLEGDIGLARNRYVLTVRNYNRERESFFGAMVASARGFAPYANFMVNTAPAGFPPEGARPAGK